jgi:hypothetical protein
METTAFLDVTKCSVIDDYQYFRKIFPLSLSGKRTPAVTEISPS